jgi:hypothetical protein
MQLSKKTCISLAIMGSAFVFNPVFADTAKPKSATTAQAKKTYTEDEFLNTFSGKNRRAITQQLGQPTKKEQGVRPSNANAAIAQLGQKPGDTSKPVNVEMWYYSDLVRYDAKRTYKQTELTFVNDRVMNITFFNSK